MNKLKTTMAFLMSFLSIKQLPIENGKSNFSDEQKEKMKDKLGDKITSDVIAAIDKEAAIILQEQEDNSELEAIREELQLALKGTSASEEEVINQVKQERNEKAGNNQHQDLSLAEEVRNLAQQLVEANKRQDNLIAKLINEPEGDLPDLTGKINPSGKMKHSKTHLFASAHDYDAFESRPWNRRAAGLTQKPTNFASSTGVEISKLNDDLDHYYRENPEVIRSLHRDRFGLPSFWGKKTNVVDEIAEGTIVSDEISQARKLPWLPKNKQKINAEIGKIYPVQIDIEFVGKMLQDFEQTWVSKIVGGGSQPYKDSFVAFLVNELNKKARNEDRKASINGIYVPTPDSATVAGAAINRQDGLLIQLWRAYYIDEKFKSANIGVPTTANILDYVQDVIEKNLDEVVRNESGLVYYLSPSWFRAYKTRYRGVHGIEMDFDGTTWKIPNYPNIRFETLVDIEGSDFMFITYEDNIEILENIPAEKSLYRFDKLKRNTYVYADYKLGIRMIHIGNKVKLTDPDAFKVQTVWTNNQPMFDDNVFAPLHAAPAGEVKLPYKNIQVSADLDADIETLKNTFAGEVIQIRGNADLAVARKVKDSTGNIDLASDYDLSTGGTLTLYVDDDGNITELKRTNSPAVVTANPVKFTDDTVDADQGSEQEFHGTTAKTLASITNGTEGQTLTIVQKTSNALTINDVAGNVQVDSKAILAAANDTIKFVKYQGVWYEVSRTIA